METDENHHGMAHFMTDDMDVFRQIDYLWLFDNELKFSNRPDFKLDDSSITVEDYQSMRLLNRQTLTQFLKEKQNDNMETDQEIEEGYMWADENLDEAIRELLSIKENGGEVPLDMVAHMEYFYNTLECHFKFEDPFRFPERYPALQFSHKEVGSGLLSEEKTLYERHKEVIFPNSACRQTQS